MSEQPAVMTELGSGVSRVDRVIARVLEVACVILMAGLLLVVSGAVLLRLLNISPAGTDALIRLMFVWLSFIGATLILREGGHLAITALTNRLRGRWFHGNLLVVELLVLVFLVVTIKTGWNYATSSPRSVPGLPISTIWGHAAIPLTAALMATYMAVRVVVRVRKLMSGADTSPEIQVESDESIPPS